MNAPVINNMQHAGVTDAVKLVRVARHVLLHATWRLDDAGYECLVLNDIYAEVAILLSDWAGGRRPDAVPGYFAGAAREWRRRHGRSY